MWMGIFYKALTLNEDMQAIKTTEGLKKKNQCFCRNKSPDYVIPGGQD